jgi:pimeloyl-ACP methyl ester carboxylesterase
MTEFLNVPGGRIAYDVTGEGPLVVCVPGMGDIRATFRLLTPPLVEAGYRVATMDIRGHGESSTGWASYTQTSIGADILTLIHHLDGPAVVIGHSFTSGSAIAAAAHAPADLAGIVLLSTATGAPKLNPLLALLAKLVVRSPALWTMYLRSLYPGTKPADFDAYLTTLKATLRQPGRTAAFAAVTPMAKPYPIDAMALGPRVQCPALIVMGTKDKDVPDPKAEAEAVAAALGGPTEIVMLQDAGHYLHAQLPTQTAAAIRGFLEATIRA